MWHIWIDFRSIHSLMNRSISPGGGGGGWNISVSLPLNPPPDIYTFKTVDTYTALSLRHVVLLRAYLTRLRLPVTRLDSRRTVHRTTGTGRGCTSRRRRQCPRIRSRFSSANSSVSTATTARAWSTCTRTWAACTRPNTSTARRPIYWKPWKITRPSSTVCPSWTCWPCRSSASAPWETGDWRYTGANQQRKDPLMTDIIVRLCDVVPFARRGHRYVTISCLNSPSKKSMQKIKKVDNADAFVSNWLVDAIVAINSHGYAPTVQVTIHSICTNIL